jgi:hypothetical protein
MAKYSPATRAMPDSGMVANGVGFKEIFLVSMNVFRIS